MATFALNEFVGEPTIDQLNKCRKCQAADCLSAVRGPGKEGAARVSAPEGARAEKV